MTFFNKKTEALQVEMTPYGRYLYSIGKFKPHSYEFVDDDILYKTSASTEPQEDAHARILDNTPKLKTNRASQNILNRFDNPEVAITAGRETILKNNLFQDGLYALGKSSYSSERTPAFQLSMLQGDIAESETVYQTLGRRDTSGSVFIPQIEIDFTINASLKNELSDPSTGKEFVSETFENGKYIELSFSDPIIHIKEFGSFYEKDNFEIEIFSITSDQGISRLKINKKLSDIEDGILSVERDADVMDSDSIEYGPDHSEYYFDVEVDREIPPEVLCGVVGDIEVTSQFLDDDLKKICEEVERNNRTDRFDIYASSVGPDDLEDCD